MLDRRQSILGLAASAALSVCLLAGCSGKGEDMVADKDLATTSAIKTGFGAAGSTFVAPMMANWITAYKQVQPDTLISYRPTGSGSALGELQQGILSLAASDAPLSDDQITKMFPVIQVPVTAGPVCAIYNVPGVTTPLRFSGSTLAAIFAGNIISWQDPAIARDNPGTKLPHAAIIVVHRADGSGTTNIFTGYLSKVSPEWAKGPGQGLSVSWPAGIGAEGTKGVVDFVKKYPGTIGYAELSYAKENKLSVAAIQNRSGSFVAPSSATTTAAIEASSDALSKDVRTPIFDPPASAKDAYPIAGLTFLILPKDGTDAEARKAIKDFIQYAVTTGQESVESLDYAKLPKSLQQQDLTLLGGMTLSAQTTK
jgi:phosphate transport system substrate-binding protein